MPIIEYRCPVHGITAEIFLVASKVTNTIKCKTEGCDRRIEKIPSVSHFKVKFGVAYGYATPSDRDSWYKKYDQQGWTTDQQTHYEAGQGIPSIRDKLN